VRLLTPTLAIETVAAGGGSILSFDGLRARVGPRSAGALPGPAAYGRGGPATVTDANLLLGRLDPDRFPRVFGAGGDQPLDVAAARRALEALARQMGTPTAEAAAEGFLAIAVEQMAQGVRRISTERGFDPREHDLVAFGGAGGQVACQMAEALGVRRVLCPLYGSLLSAYGVGAAEVSALRQGGLEHALDCEGLKLAQGLASTLEAQARAALADQGMTPGRCEITLRLRYEGADAELPAPLMSEDEVRATFEEAHQRLFGFVERARPILIASVEAEAVETTAETRLGNMAPPKGPDPASSAPEQVVIYLDGRAWPAPVVEAEGLEALSGPALIVREDTQITVPAGWRARPGQDGMVILERGLAPDAPAPARNVAAAVEAPDPVTLELFNRRFMGVAEAMGAALERTAHSVNIKERLDFSCALFDADGGLVANAPHMPVHLGSMGASVRAVRDRRPVLRPGEAFALNNPYAGGTHLPDITVVMPVFVSEGDQPTFYMAARGHHADIGGIQPGSMPPFSRAIAEEG
ncbi:MAG TPA: hydantoinase B/oxoprolinase family protein, partial [Phenylobacterium sp.]|nr:hydantoinase B/oxoprolinase family protein [Phenylobacterium sp.]